MLIISIMGSQKGKGNYAVAFCIPWASCGNMCSNEGEGFMWSFDASRKIYSVIFYRVCLVSGQHSSSSFFFFFSSCHLVVNMELILCLVRRSGIIFSGLLQFSWIWVEKNQTPRNVASFTQPIDSVELTLPGYWCGVSQDSESWLQGRAHTHWGIVEPGVAGPWVLCWGSPRLGPGSANVSKVF